jgi:perosamine synthetase
MRQIKLFEPSITQREVDAVSKTLLSGWIGMGPKVEEFEGKFAEFVGVKYAVATSSCTAALEIAMQLLDVRGKEVIVPAITFVSTAHAVVKHGGRVVFCDVDPDSLLMDIDFLAGRDMRNVAAIIPVHLGGNRLDLPFLEEQFPLSIVEDCAHACGTQGAGLRGEVACWSFHAVKNLATGDGGMLTTDHKAFYERAKSLRWLGITKDTWARDKNSGYNWEYDVHVIGDKSHMNDINASIGLVQLERLEAMNDHRALVAQRYLEGIAWGPKIKFPVLMGNSSLHLFPIQCEHRDDLMEYLRVRGISTGVHYKPINLYSCYGDYQPCPVAERIWKKLLSLPIHANLSLDDVDYIVEAINGFKI